VNWKNIIKGVAPTFATALGGPMAGAAVAAIAKVVLPSDQIETMKNNPGKLRKEIGNALASADPEILARLKEADTKFETRMAELGIDLEEIHAQDRASARNREIKVGGHATPMLAAVVIGGFLLMAGYLIGWGMPETASAGLIGTVIGYVSAKADQVVSYYFGSSAGSARKNELLNRNQNRG
jgi:hypothetical protein